MPGSDSSLRVVDVDEPRVSVDPVVVERIVDATLALISRWGVSKTALGDIAKEAGCGRATLYRAFPGGKQHLLAVVAGRELTSYRDAIIDALDAGDDLADAVTRGLVVATRLFRDHDAAQFILEHEPGLVLPFLGFGQVNHLYRHASDAFSPHLGRFVSESEAEWLAEWTTRLFLSYLFNPRLDVDLADVEHTRSLVETFLLPTFLSTTVTASPS